MMGREGGVGREGRGREGGRKGWEEYREEGRGR